MTLYRLNKMCFYVFIYKCDTKWTNMKLHPGCLQSTQTSDVVVLAQLKKTFLVFIEITFRAIRYLLIYLSTDI